jgi:prepilin peptidase CpaA
MLIIYAILTFCVLIAAIYDAATHKIPNWISLIIVVSGLSWNCFSAEGLGLRVSSAGLVAGLMLMMPGYIFAGTGAGDVKLMAAIGSVVGFDDVLNIFLYSYITMLVLAIVFLTLKGDMGKLLRRYQLLVYGLLAGSWCYQKPDKSDAASYRMSLAPAIALSTFYVLHLDICKLSLIADLCHF